MIHEITGEERMKVYIGGPMFEASDILYNRMLRDLLLKNGLEIYCPNDNEAINDKSRTDITGEKIYEGDIEKLEECNVFLCRVSQDPGTLWEAGYMDCLAKKVDPEKYYGCIGLATDIRLATVPDPSKGGVDNQTMYLNQFMIGGLKLSLGVATSEEELIEKLCKLRSEREA